MVEITGGSWATPECINNLSSTSDYTLNILSDTNTSGCFDPCETFTINMKIMPDSINFVYDYAEHHGQYIRLEVFGSDGITVCPYQISSDSDLIIITPDDTNETKNVVEVQSNSLDLTNKPEINTSVIFTATLDSNG